MSVAPFDIAVGYPVPSGNLGIHMVGVAQGKGPIFLLGRDHRGQPILF